MARRSATQIAIDHLIFTPYQTKSKQIQADPHGIRSKKATTQHIHL